MEQLMALRVTFLHSEKSVAIIADGEISPSDIMSNLKLIDSHDARGYRKLIDVSKLRSTLSAEEVTTLAMIAISREAQGPVGPIAVIVGDNQVLEEAARRVATVGSVMRPISVFRDKDEARTWLASQSSDTQ
jgi:hypothetical protein